MKARSPGPLLPSSVMAKDLGSGGRGSGMAAEDHLDGSLSIGALAGEACGAGLRRVRSGGTMAGYFEVRVDGRDRRHYRLFCVLERDGARLGLGGPSIVVITGMEKPFRTTFSERDYAQVRLLGEEYGSRAPRSVLR